MKNKKKKNSCIFSRKSIVVGLTSFFDCFIEVNTYNTILITEIRPFNHCAKIRPIFDALFERARVRGRTHALRGIHSSTLAASHVAVRPAGVS